MDGAFRSAVDLLLLVVGPLVFVQPPLHYCLFPAFCNGAVRCLIEFRGDITSFFSFALRIYLAFTGVCFFPFVFCEWLFWYRGLDSVTVTGVGNV